MKRTFILIGALLLSGHFSFGQNSTERYITNAPHLPTNIERFKMDYELVDNSLVATDKSLLETLELWRIEYVREDNQDVVFFEKNAGIEILVYSREKTTTRKSSANTIYHEKN